MILEVTGQMADLWALSLTGDDRSGWKAEETTDFVVTQFSESAARFSPDGSWVAYSSNESSQDEVFVRSFPGVGGKTQISIGESDSDWPSWSEPHQELIFCSQSSRTERQIFTVKYQIDGEGFIPERPVRWEGAIATSRRTSTIFDLHPDGERVLVRSRVEPSDTEQDFDHVILFENFFAHLEKIVPTR